ncbi:MAG: YdcF family protein, partial [Deltaproteobacteria bacterium]|nr:YdcF family protein [Deltaproteobacteria bacterium]
HNPKLEKVDLIVVFPGAESRIAEGFRLAGKGYSDNFAITGVNEKQVNAYTETYGLPPKVKQIFDRPSVTTFEDSLATRSIVKKRGFHSVILVTSDYHVPRAYFLLRALLTGLDVKIQTYRVSENDMEAHDRLRASGGKRVMYNEMVKFWASIGEMIGYGISGDLLTEREKVRTALKRMKSWVLFDIKG